MPCWRPACVLLLFLIAPALASSPWRAGEPLPGLDEEQVERFFFGKAQFSREFDPAEGLGPTTNNSSCALCHFQPVGGWGEQRVTRFGYMNANGQFSPTDPLGDTLWQHVGVTEDENCREVIPPEANHSALRITIGSTGFARLKK